MSASVSRRLGWLLSLSGLMSLAACGNLRGESEGFWGTVTPYKVEIVQGNIVSREQVQALQIGMNRLQVREILGTPLAASIFRTDRWDYVFTIRRQGVAPLIHQLSVYFEGDELKRIEGDDMPSDAEFVARLESTRKTAAVPDLRAPDDVLNRAPTGSKGAAAEAAAALPPLPVAYPPLEPAPAQLRP